jgi:hypothetical protein
MAEEKYYIINAISEDAFDTLHEYLTTNTSVPNVPDREVICENYTLQSPTRGTYLLTDDEKIEVEQRPEVEYVNLDVARYPEMKIPSDQLRCDIPPQVDRYDSNVSNYFNYFTNYNGLASSDNGAATSQLLRMRQKDHPWAAQSTATRLSDMPRQRGTAKDIDVVVGDNGSWIGHPEFMNDTFHTGSLQPGLAGKVPQNFIPGNVLSKRNGRDADNATAPLCNVLDMVLDSPYYIDPEWFDANPGARLTTRWDGTVVPVESVARSWWGSSTQRSAQFANIGTVFVTTNYTRDRAHGSNTVGPGDGTHGTQCASLTFGKTHGWAYNANKWVIDAYGDSFLGFEQYFDIMKIFHTNKPINSTYGTQDPTISSNSWGFRVSTRTSGWSNYRGTDYSFTTNSNATNNYRVIRQNGDGRVKHYPKPNSLFTASNECADAGVILVMAAGNDSQQQVLPDHPNWDNFHWSASGATIEETNQVELGSYYNAYASVNRPGWPQCAGPTEDGRFKAINIGALDDDWGEGTTIGSQDNKAYYSDCGPAVDCYAPADTTLAAAAPSDGTVVTRFDNTYTGLSADAGTADDTTFNGTSAACPVACGFLATVLEHNRAWDWSNIKDYIKNTIEQQFVETMYIGNDYADPYDAGWLDTRSLAGGDPIVLYEGDYTISNPSLITTNSVRRVRGPISLRGGLSIRFKK